MNRSVFGLLAAGALLGPCEMAGVHDPHWVVVGTWGGENAGLIADDTSAHVHIGCTFGDVLGGIELGTDGRFDAPGSYVLRAYPVAVGPSLPARFQGTLVPHRSLTLTVVVQDTTADTTVTLGPVKLFLGREPQMGPCPICRTRGERMASRLLTGS